MAYSSTFRVLAFSLLISALSLGGIASAIAQDNKQPTPQTTQTAPAAALQNSSVQQAPAATDQQQAPVPVSGVVQQQKPVINDLKQQTKRISDQLPKAASNDESLANLKLQLDSLSKKLLEAGVAFRPRLSEINTRLEQLGPAPSGDQPPEPAIVSEERARLTAEKAEINAVVGETEDTSLSVNQMSAKIGDMRRDLFARTLSQRVNIDTTLGTEVASAASNQMVSLWRIVQSWWRFVSTFKLKSFLAAAFFAFVAALVIQIGAKRVLGTLYQRDATVESPSYLSRLSVAFWSTVIPSAAVGVFLAATYFFMNYFNVLRTDIATLFQSLFLVLGLVFFIHRLASACISSDMPQWRLVPVAPRPGRVLGWLITGTALTSGLDSFFGKVNQILSSPLSLTMAKSLLATVMVGVLILAIAFLKPVEREKDGAIRSWPRGFKTFLIILGLLPILAAVFGFIGMARFISQQIVVTGAFLVTMYMGFLTGRAISEEQAFASSQIGKAMRERFHFDDATLDQLGLLAGILINLVVALIGIPLVLMQLGFQWAELKSTFYQLMTGFQIGNISISLMGLLTGVLLFAIGYLLTRWFQNWLDNSVMARGRVDSGVRNSIRTVIGYVGLCLAALMGVSAAGFNMSNLALIAGGLSLGIGFGLQNIVQNFVSGLILLAERPFKVGDWVEAGTVSGIVKKISVRATEVETFQKQSIIVPNSTLINGNVGNWTHRNKLGRIDINVQASYTAEPRRIHALLLEIVRGHPSILKNPEPFVSFQSMNDSLMVFDVYAHVADITSTGGIKNELRFQIVERFHEEGLHLSSSSTDLILSVPEIEKLSELMQKEKELSPAAGKKKANAEKPEAKEDADDRA
ncbi:mechanosensitive ion channel protein [Ochrobactrum sp. POC9]|uniref:mechanosensitive ion channel family protein n=1 Tax=unclassified Ochrobactrum TaxID=239106 RepID=UPI000D70591A|nr:mechanosensitive ion channel family protein [Ochrobactrum sp. POC9]MCH4541385.1 mechanosensitive ion channel family protein [Ochrobactrum sp. A-1]PWU72317.1 mechanosensitive ion channel protein [Ochrobactrum sp. POC9]